MRIYGPNGAAPTNAKPAARRAASGAFTLPEVDAGREPAGAGAPRAVGGIETLLALQGVEDPTERRRRAVTRGRGALDSLDELKLALLAGKLDNGTIARLRTAAAGLKDASGDPRLDGLLAEIELRVEVELAKLADKRED